MSDTHSEAELQAWLLSLDERLRSSRGDELESLRREREKVNRRLAAARRTRPSPAGEAAVGGTREMMIHHGVMRRSRSGER
jgi:hypothetical protein